MSAALGGIVVVHQPTLTFQENGRRLGFSAASATLALGDAAIASITDGTDADGEAFGGSYDVARRTFLFTADELEFTSPSLFTIRSGGAFIGYFPGGVDVDLNGNGVLEPGAGDLEDATLVSLGLDQVSLSFGTGKAGFAVSGGRLGLATIASNGAADTRRYVAVRAALADTPLLGIPGLTAAASNLALATNTASGARGGIATTPLDWTRAVALLGGTGGFGAIVDPGQTLGLVNGELALNFTGSLFQASGRLTMSLLNVITGSADFFFRKQSVNVDLDHNGAADLTDASLVVLGFSHLNLFVGAGGIGFQVTGGRFALANLQPAAPADGRSYLAVKSGIDQAALTGIDGVTAAVSRLLIEANQADGTGALPLDWATALDLNNDGTFRDALNPGAAMDPSVDLTLNFAGDLLRISGRFNFNVLDFVGGSADFAFKSRSVRADLNNDDTPDWLDARLTTLALNDVDVFVGSAGVGFSVQNGQLALSQLQAGAGAAGDSRRYLAVRASLGTASLTGLPGVTAEGTNIGVQINEASGSLGALNAVALNWRTSLDLDGDGGFDDILDPGEDLTPVADLDLDFTTTLFQANGTLSFGILSFVRGSGSFAFTRMTLEAAPQIEQGAELLNLMGLALNNVNLFVGVGGNADGTPGTGVGFSITGGRMVMAQLTATAAGRAAGDNRTYLAVRATIGNAALVGIPSLTAQASNLSIEINQASGARGPLAAQALNWTTTLDLEDNGSFGDLFDPGQYLVPPVAMPINFEAKLLRVKGYVTLAFSQFVHLSGNFAFEKGDDMDVYPVGGASPVRVSVLKVGAAGVQAFAGLGGPYWRDTTGNGIIDGSDTPDAANAVGMALQNVGFGLALMKPVSGGAVSYYALKATGTAALVGVPGLELSGNNFRVEINRASDGSAAVDFDRLLPARKMEIPTGPSSSVDLDFTRESLKVSGTVTLNISDFVRVSGDFVFEKALNQTVAVVGAGNQTVELLKIGASSVNVFVGHGDLGVSLTGVELGLAILKPVSGDPPVRYYALKARGSATLGGAGAIPLSAQNMTLEVNGTTGSTPSAVVNFLASFPGSPAGLAIQTGPNPANVVRIDFDHRLLRASGLVTLSISQFVHVSGSFAFEDGGTERVTLTDGTAFDASVVEVGASHVFAFVGLNGPYWTDRDGDGDIDEADAPASSSAIGVVLEEVSLALALMKPVSGGAVSYHALKASGSVRLVGVTGVTLTGVGSIEVNGTNDAAQPNRVVNFAASFPAAGGDPAGLPVATGPGASDVIRLDFNQALLRGSGHLFLGFGGLSLEGDFFFEKTTNALNGAIIKVAVTNMRFSLAAGGTTLLSITNGNGLLLITPAGLAGELSVSVSFSLPAGLSIGFDAISVAVNTTGQAIDETFAIPAGTRTLQLPAGPYVRVRAINVTIGVTVRGTPYTLMADEIQFERITLADASTVVRVAATGFEAELGVIGRIEDGWAGFVFYSDGMAGMAQGTVTAPLLTGDLAFFINTRTVRVDETIPVLAANFHIQVLAQTIGFSATNAVLRLGDVLELRGDYIQSQVGSGTEQRTVYGARNVTLFLGRGPPFLDEVGTPNPAAVGVLVTVPELGIVKYAADGSFALTATGTATVLGLGAGFEITGTLTVRINNTRRPVNETINLPGSGTIPVQFDSSQNIEVFTGSITIAIGGVFELSGTVSFTRRPTGEVLVDVPDAEITINIPDGSGGFEEAFGLSGSTRFTIGGAQGFKLQDLLVNGFSIFGVDATIDRAAVTIRPPTADLTDTYHGGVFNTAVVNNRHYIEIVFTPLNSTGLNHALVTDAPPSSC